MTRLDKEVVRAAVGNRGVEILEHVAHIDRKFLDGQSHPCPFCNNGKDRFTLLDPKAGAVFCRQCFPKKNGDYYSAIQKARGVSFYKSVSMVADYVGLTHTNGNGHSNGNGNGKSHNKAGEGKVNGNTHPAADGSPSPAGTPQADTPAVEIASIETRDAAYRIVLSELSLSDAHREALLARGLSDEVIEAEGYRTMPHGSRGKEALFVYHNTSVPRDEYGRVPGFIKSQIRLFGAVGLIVPHRDECGKLRSLKVRRDELQDGESGSDRYTYVSSKKHGGAMAEAAAHVPAQIVGPCPVVRVTESALKATVATHLSGLPTIGAPGVACIKKLIPTVKALGAHTIRVSVDADAPDNPAVAGAALDTLKDAAAAGLAVELERWAIEFGKGIDDVYAAGHADKIEILKGDAAIAAAEETAKAAGVEAGSKGVPEIVVTTAEHICVAEVIAALARSPNVFQRGGLLVDVIRDSKPAVRGVKPSELPSIGPIPKERLRSRISEAARLKRIVIKEGEETLVPINVPEWLNKGVYHAGYWPGIRPLEAIVCSPIMRHDGSILQTPGYDESTGILYEPLTDFPAIPDSPTIEQCQQAAETLLEVVCNFPFEDTKHHRAAWLASVLTPPARFAFIGPSPMFLIDGNAPGCGKGLLSDCGAIVTTGSVFATAAYAHDDKEMRKVITAIALSGELQILLDNVAGVLGNAALDRALTSTKWKDRLLQVNQMVELPLNVTWHGNGNNITIKADTARRICPIRIKTLDQNPEEKTGFKHPDLKAWVLENRVNLFVAALTILRGYVAAGRPPQKTPDGKPLKPWGSFEGWSALVRNAVVWVGQSDPGGKRHDFTKAADTDAAHLAVLMAGWEEIDPEREGMTTSEVFRILAKPNELPTMRGAIQEVLSGRKGGPSSDSLGIVLRKFRSRVFDGKAFETNGTHNGSAIWRIVGSENTASDQGGSGDKGDQHNIPSARDEGVNDVDVPHVNVEGAQTPPLSPHPPNCEPCQLDHGDPRNQETYDGDKIRCQQCKKHFGRVRK